MLHHTIIPWSPERMRRLIFSLICSSGKAENVPKPTSVDITSSQVRIASVEVSADDIQAAHEIHLVAVGSALDVWGQYLRRNGRRPRRYLRRCALAPLEFDGFHEFQNSQWLQAHPGFRGRLPALRDQRTAVCEARCRSPRRDSSARKGEP